MNEEEKINQPLDEILPSTNEENISGPSIINEQPHPAVSSNEPTTEIMEVHKDPHHVTHKKKWGEYLLEFFMLFLAVFLGFIAENIREESVEHQRAKVYAANLIDELKKDTAGLNDLISRHKLISGKLDTFCLLSKEKKQRNVSNGMLYYYASYATDVSYFSPHNATIEQLKSSGNLRLMSNEAAHEISEYDQEIRSLEREYGLSKSEFEKIESMHFKLFDIYLMQTLLPNNETKAKARDAVFMNNSLTVRDDEEKMNEYVGLLKFEASIYLLQIRRYLSPIKQKAAGLLELLKKEYHLE